MTINQVATMGTRQGSWWMAASLGPMRVRAWVSSAMKLPGASIKTGGGETKFIGLPATGGVKGEGMVWWCCGDMGLQVAMCVFVGVGKGVELLARILGGGLVGGEEGFSPRGLAHVVADGGVGLRVGYGSDNLLQRLGVQCR